MENRIAFWNKILGGDLRLEKRLALWENNDPRLGGDPRPWKFLRGGDPRLRLGVLTGWQSLYRHALTLLVPPLCPLCSTLTANGGLCPSCWQGLSLAAESSCQQCALPFEHDNMGRICAECIARPPAFDRAVAGLTYNDTAKALILGLKYGDRLDTAPVLAQLMLTRGRGLLGSADVVIPLPLHPRRFRIRRFNQSAELARHLIRLAGVSRTKFRPECLIRHRDTVSQGRMSRYQRRRNLASAFRVQDHAQSAITGKTVLLIDDVLTTGASLAAAAKCLKKAGAEQVTALVAARVR